MFEASSHEPEPSSRADSLWFGLRNRHAQEAWLIGDAQVKQGNDSSAPHEARGLQQPNRETSPGRDMESKEKRIK